MTNEMAESQNTASDGRTAMQSLLTAYADDDDAAMDESVVEQHPGANFISDDEDEHHSSTDQKLLDDKSKSDVLTDPESNTESPASKRFKVQNTEAVHSTTRLVSYVDDEQDDDAERNDSDASEDEMSSQIIFGKQLTDNAIVRNGSTVTLERSPADANTQDASVVSPAATSDKEIMLPPEASGKCSKRLQEKVEKLFEKMKREGRDLNYEIQKRKDFRNPSIYEKIIEFCGIDEKGTNYPPELFHPDNWVLDENSYYDKLAQAQLELMQKKEREAKKSKVERQVGIKKTVSEPSALANKH